MQSGRPIAAGLGDRMSDAQTDKPDGKRRSWVAAWIICALLVYVLSFGPATWIAGADSSGWCRAVYWPIIWLAENYTPATRIVLWYIDLCRPSE
jgi:hypothetical protein